MEPFGGKTYGAKEAVSGSSARGNGKLVRSLLFLAPPLVVRKVLKPRLMLVFAGMVGLGIL